jgi:hypothetical protein
LCLNAFEGRFELVIVTRVGFEYGEGSAFGFQFAQAFQGVGRALPLRLRRAKCRAPRSNIHSTNTKPNPRNPVTR